MVLFHFANCVCLPGGTHKRIIPLTQWEIPEANRCFNGKINDFQRLPCNWKVSGVASCPVPSGTIPMCLPSGYD